MSQFIRKFDDKKGITECFNNYGVVAIENVLTKDECMKTLMDKDLPYPDGFDISDISTYDLLDTAINQHGVLGTSPLWTQRILKNRCNHRVYECYS